MTIRMFGSEADPCVKINFAANASSALSLPWSSASGCAIFLKKASSLLSRSVQDRTILCNLSLEILLTDKFTAWLFGV